MGTVFHFQGLLLICQEKKPKVLIQLDRLGQPERAGSLLIWVSWAIGHTVRRDSATEKSGLFECMFYFILHIFINIFSCYFFLLYKYFLYIFLYKKFKLIFISQMFLNASFFCYMHNERKDTVIREIFLSLLSFFLF